MDVQICIPFGSADAHRSALVEFVLRRWAHFFDWPILVADGGSPFSRSVARNHALDAATADVLIFCDADTTFLDDGSIHQAVSVARAGGWTLPEMYFECGRPWSQSAQRDPGAVLDPPRRGQYVRALGNSPGGIMVAPRAALEAVHGWDEGFQGWGWEDTALRSSLDALYGPHSKVGSVVHLWHPRDRRAFLGQPHAAVNRARARRYAEAWSAGTMESLYAELGRA